MTPNVKETPKTKYYHPGSEWLCSHYDSLPRQCWSAATAQGKVAEHPTFDGLMDAIERLGIPYHEVATIYRKLEDGPPLSDD